MMRLMVAAAVAAMALASSGPADARDSTGYLAIASGNLTAAERTLSAERRIFPGRPELMLNLAAIYAQTGRTTQAAALYRQALAASDVAMQMPNGAIASSRDVARRGQSHLATVEVASN